ncbi:MAG TPA: hypothetical protein DCQ89_02015 [Psychrobacter sp.]|nr:hypothetical protein [Psychrobacter sp.]
MNILNKILASITLTGLIISTPAIAKIKNADDLFSIEEVEIWDDPVGDGVRSTTWTAKPFVILSPSDRKLKPEVMMLYVSATGYEGVFENLVQIDCKNPVKSHVVDGNPNGRNISFKESMAYPDDPWDENFGKRIDRKAVEGLFRHFCS